MVCQRGHNQRIQEEEQNQKGSIIFSKPYRTSNYKRWKKLYKIHKKKKEQKFKKQNPKQAKQEHRRMDERWRRRWMRWRCNTRDAALERAARGQRAPTSEIYSQARVTHTPTRGCQMAKVQTADESGNT